MSSEAARLLADAGIDDAAREVRLILSHLLKTPLSQIRPESIELLNTEQHARFEAMIARRAAREPLSHILGAWEFWSLPLRITPDVLTPRPDTECLVETILNGLPDRTASFRIADLGTGSGAILLALLSECPNATGVGADISQAALAIAQDNARRTGFDDRCRFVQSDWGQALDGPFDVIVSNPPYIETKIVTGLEPEVSRFEPHGALDGGADGLDAYRRILDGLDPLAAPGCLLGFEIGFDQAETVAALMERHGWLSPRLTHDFGGNPRVLTARK